MYEGKQLQQEHQASQGKCAAGKAQILHALLLRKDKGNKAITHLRAPAGPPHHVPEGCRVRLTKSAMDPGIIEGHSQFYILK